MPKQRAGFGQAVFQQVLVGRGVQTCPEASQAFRFADMGAFGQFIECDGGGVVVFDVFEETFHARGDRVVRFFRRDADVFQQVEP